MSVLKNNSSRRPRVCLVGDHPHPDFVDAVALLRADADLISESDNGMCPDLIVVAQSRPGVWSRRQIDELRRAAPLAGVVALLGSWCEGQNRASRPTHDIQRLYWYQFTPWWQRQMELRAAGRCPEWARPEGTGFQADLLSTPYSVPSARPSFHRGLIAINTLSWETADTLALLLRRAGYATMWQPAGQKTPVLRGVAAGIWDGCQLDDREAADLAVFCQRLAEDSAPVIALVDFPRRDRCEVARQTGAALVIGKPWSNADLLASLKIVTQNTDSASAA